MKLRTLARFAAIPTAFALLASLAACSPSSTENTPKPVQSGAVSDGSDQVSVSKHTTKTVTPLDQINIDELGLISAGKLSVGTLSDAPPNIFLDENGVFTGFDNELLRAIGAKLGLEVEFSSTEFAGLLAQVKNKAYDVGSSNITSTSARRETVGFTNGYDFGYMSLVTKKDAKVQSIEALTDKQIVAVITGTVQDEYVTNSLQIEPKRFPDYNSAYAAVKSGLVDAWLAPSSQAKGQIKTDDNSHVAEEIIDIQNFMGYAVNSNNQKLIDALNSGLDAVIEDGTWSKLIEEWYPGREIPKSWKPGSLAVTVPNS